MDEYTVIVLEGELTPFVRGTPKENAEKLSVGGLVELVSMGGEPAFINADKVLCLASYEDEEDGQ
jgi:hypothetical protein